jgi:Fe-S-cluster containining protein
VEDGDWYINIKNKCKHLSEKDYRCRIYDKRPRICRGYRHADCDYVEGEYDFELHFTDDKQMEEYIKIKFDNNKTEKRKAKKKKIAIKTLSHKDTKAQRKYEVVKN